MLRMLTALSCASLLFAGPALAQDDLAFETDVGAAIDDGLDWLKAQDAFTGGNGSIRQARGIALLALLEKRAGVAPDAPELGYVGSPPADQALAREAGPADHGGRGLRRAPGTSTPTPTART